MQPIGIVNSILNSMTNIITTGHDNDCWLVDCSDVEKVIDRRWNVKGVLLTHAHTDHLYGLNKLVEEFPDVKVCTNAEGKEGLLNPKLNFSKYHEDVEDFIFRKPDNILVLEEEKEIALDESLKAEVYFTPRHDSSCITYRIENYLFTGAIYISGVKVMTGFLRSNKKDALASLK